MSMDGIGKQLTGKRQALHFAGGRWWLPNDHYDQIANASGSQPINVFNFVNTAYSLPAGSDIDITPLATSFSTSAVSQDVVIRVVINADVHWDSCFYLKIDGVEVGSPSNTGSRMKGISPVPFDNDIGSTMQTIFIQYKHTVSAGNHQLNIGFRQRFGTNAFYLNRTADDTDGTSTGCERACSSVSIDFVSSA